MSQNFHRTEGVVLHVLPFRDYDRILTLFTLELGIVKTIMRNTLIPKAIQGSINPLTRAEFVLNPGKGDLMPCQDISLINQNLRLREQLNWLQAACSMAHALNTSQMAHKPAPDLYRLLVSYLEKLPTLPNSQVLVSSFYIKMLRHEGLLNIDGDSLETYPPHSFSFSSTELRIMQSLNLCRSFTELATLKLSPELAQKVKDLFKQLFS